MISIPARRILFPIIFFGLWLCGWAVGEVALAADLLFDMEPRNDTLGGLAWLCMWTVAGVLAGITWAWITFGYTRVEVAGGNLNLGWKVLGLGIRRSYDVNKITRLRPRVRLRTWLWSRWPDGESPFAGTILFDYDGKTVDFGAGLGESETDLVIEELRKLFQLSTSDE